MGCKLGCDGAAYMTVTGRVKRRSMYWNIWAYSCTCVSTRVPVCRRVYKCMDSRQDDWRAAGGGGAGQAAVVSVNLCPLPPSPGLVSHRNNKHDPRTRHLGYRVSTLKLNQSQPEEPRAAQYSLLYWMSPYCKYGLATVDNSQWASVRETEVAHC